jgi:predicted kinase
MPGRLIVFSGLPGVGKTSIARAAARALGAILLRADTIEQPLFSLGLDDLADLGYRVAYAVASENLALGHTVIADCVNGYAIAREAWRAAGEAANAEVAEVEIVCSDRTEHKSRIEGRVTDIEGLTLPTWAEIVSRDYEPWTRPPIRIDTAGRTVEASVTQLLAALDR